MCLRIRRARGGAKPCTAGELPLPAGVSVKLLLADGRVTELGGSAVVGVVVLAGGAEVASWRAGPGPDDVQSTHRSHTEETR